MRFPVLFVLFLAACGEATNAPLGGGDGNAGDGGVSANASAANSAPSLSSSDPLLRNAAAPPAIASVSPSVVDPAGDSFVTVHGTALGTVTAVRLDETPVPFSVDAAGEIHLKTSAVAEGAHRLTVTNAAGTADAAITAWAPTALAGAHVFDARDGLAAEEASESHAWTRLTAAIAPSADGTAWTHRDGPCVKYLPKTEKYWMIGGWNGYEPGTVAPGWSSVSTNEVWSSVDGASWTLELPHASPAPANRFSPRHFFGCTLLGDRLWILGGDYTEAEKTAYHSDAWSTVDGVHWTKSEAPLPWASAAVNEPRMLSVVGTFKNKLWLFGGQNGFLGEAPEDIRFYNDLWSSSDGVAWTRAQANDPRDGLTDRPSPRGIVSELVDFRGELWLVGGARYTDPDTYAKAEETYFSEVWSTDGEDHGSGIVWKKHAAPPWVGRRYGSVKVFDGKMWLIGGYTNSLSYNLHDVWWSADGETWTEDRATSIPFEESHADGIAVGPSGLVFAGGNYTLGNYFDTQTWHLSSLHGTRVAAWTARASTLPGGGPTLRADGEQRPLAIPGTATAGAVLHFDGENRLDLGDRALQPTGRTVVWVAKTPYFPEQNKGAPHAGNNPHETIVGDSFDGTQQVAVGLDGGRVAATAVGKAGWSLVTGGGSLTENQGITRVYAVTHAPSTEGGTATTYADGLPLTTRALPYPAETGWRTIGAGAGGFDGIHGDVGAVLVIDRAISAEELSQIAAWAAGRWP